MYALLKAQLLFAFVSSLWLSPRVVSKTTSCSFTTQWKTKLNQNELHVFPTQAHTCSLRSCTPLSVWVYTIPSFHPSVSFLDLRKQTQMDNKTREVWSARAGKRKGKISAGKNQQSSCYSIVYNCWLFFPSVAFYSCEHSYLKSCGKHWNNAPLHSHNTVLHSWNHHRNWPWQSSSNIRIQCSTHTSRSHYCAATSFQRTKNYLFLYILYVILHHIKKLFLVFELEGDGALSFTS